MYLELYEYDMVSVNGGNKRFYLPVICLIHYLIWIVNALAVQELISVRKNKYFRIS